MKWNNNFSVGNDVIDNQHKLLLKSIEDFHTACKNHSTDEAIVNTLKFLAKYTVNHFKDEEKYMADNGYPKLADHKIIHSNFVNEVKDIIAKVNREGIKLSLVMELNKKLNDWLINHIMKVDKEYQTYIANK